MAQQAQWADASTMTTMSGSRAWCSFQAFCSAENTLLEFFAGRFRVGEVLGLHSLLHREFWWTLLAVLPGASCSLTSRFKLNGFSWHFLPEIEGVLLLRVLVLQSLVFPICVKKIQSNSDHFATQKSEKETKSHTNAGDFGLFV